MIDYTSLERDDLMVYAEGNGQLDYVQREVYAGSERLEQFTDRTNGGYERLLYVHEDLQGNTRYYTKENGNSFAELTYDAWGMPISPNKFLNNDHGNYVYATYTGHIFDTTLDIYFCEARFYDANTRQWMAMDPVKDGGNWYQYCYSNPLRYWDPNGLWVVAVGGTMGAAGLLGTGMGGQIAIDGHWNVAVYSFAYGGAGTISKTTSLSVSYYWADSVHDLQGLSYSYGAGINSSALGFPIPINGTIDISHGRLDDGSLVWGVTLTGKPMEFIPIEFHFNMVKAEELLSGNLVDFGNEVFQGVMNMLDEVKDIVNALKSYFSVFEGC